MWKLEVWFWIFVAVFNTGRSFAESRQKDLGKPGIKVHSDSGSTLSDVRPGSSASGSSDPASVCTAERPGSTASSSKSGGFTPISGGGW